MPNFEDWTITTVYILCSVVGGAVLTLQMVLMLFGGDADVDMDADGDLGGDDGLGLLSIRSVASFLTFFGLVGWYGQGKGWGDWQSALVGLLAGVSMMVLVAWVMSQYKRLDSDGNVDPENAVGLTATVYLRIPASGEGRGKITVAVQNRTQEFQATTKGEAISTGTEVRVVRMITQDTFEVEPAD